MRKNKTTGIYCIENLSTHKKYIGQSVNIEERWYKHKKALNDNCHDNQYLQNSWNKYDSEDFVFSIIEECPLEKLDEKECYYIELYNTLDRNYGYNLKTGGQNGGAIVSEEIRDKMSSILKETFANNPELRSQKRELALKQWSNPEIKAKITGENNGMYGKTHSEEAREKISKTHKGKPSPKRNMTPVYCVELDKVFECAVQAAKELNISNQILEVCYGNRKTCGGYHWNFYLGNNIS